MPLLDKITQQIEDAYVIVADCSGRNANVFFELGIAHAHAKPVILITRDPIQEAPSDIRCFEFFHYELDNHVAFLERLDNALRHLLFEPYEPLYKQALGIFRQFVENTRCDARPAGRDEFFNRVREAERRRGLPASQEEKDLIEFFLPTIVENIADAAVMEAIVAWISDQRRTTSS